MHQITLRVPDSLARQLKHAARVRRESVNAYSTAVLAAAVNPDLAGSEVEALRERLSRAGLLADLSPASVKRPSRASVARARAEAGRGRRLSELISDARR